MAKKKEAKVIQLKVVKGLDVFTSMSHIYKHAEERNEKLTLSDFDHEGVCIIQHTDGSQFTVTNPKLETVILEMNIYKEGILTIWKELVYIVYSEHHSPFVYMASDLEETPVMAEMHF